ncbi:NAD(P)/FAD-dependent oxidoreductase [Zavarzinella formosa]|uniref:NAD(P)/FAD-dependent oxidoreductase n=1 Tax=Zavarzinella formosa TaxID=360055 RepID=UPI000306C68F|nr:NAD(P)/FAD-dependent oxidoreductase [Zavarzinella formosa]
MTNQSLHYGIVGGGMVGLGLARRLAKLGHQVTILEAGDSIGGLAGAWQLGDVTWDKHYHVILMSDFLVRDLVAEIGLEQDFRWVETKTGFYTDGQMYSMSNSMEFLKFPPLGLLDKIRLAMTITVASKIRDWRYLERVPVATWLKRWSGGRTLEKIWIPLLKAKLGDAYRESMATFIWATIARMYAARRSGLKKEMFGYVHGGYHRILAALKSSLEKSGVRVITGAKVAGIRSDATGVRCEISGTEHRFDRMILTTNPHVTNRLLPELPAEDRHRLTDLRYQGIVCVSVLLRKPLDRFYVTNITDSWVPFTAVIEMSALVNREEFNGHSLVYLPKYVAPDDPLFDESDASIRNRFLAALSRMYPHFSEADVIELQVSRVREVFAISSRDYSKRVMPFKSSLPNIWLANSSQIVNGTLNVNESLALADRAVKAIHPEATFPPSKR